MWWDTARKDFELCISEIVLDEAGAGDSEAAYRRVQFLQDLPLLDVTDATASLADAILKYGLLPQGATRDALHIAVSSVHGVDILLTWNCRHIANATIAKELREFVLEFGYELPILCTPEELLGDLSE